MYAYACVLYGYVSECVYDYDVDDDDDDDGGGGDDDGGGGDDDGVYMYGRVHTYAHMHIDRIDRSVNAPSHTLIYIYMAASILFTLITCITDGRL